MGGEPRGLDHGRRISLEEYQKGVVAIQAELPPMPTREQDRTARRAALDLAIDHRLGVDFPKERRAALFAVQQELERRRLWVVLRHGLARLFRFSREPAARGLAHFAVDEYAKVLSRPELEAFFGREEAASPALPVDRGDRG
jgi:hypothetical protein